MAYDPIKDATSGGPLSLNVSWYKDLLETKHSWKLIKTDYQEGTLKTIITIAKLGRSLCVWYSSE